MYALYFFYDEVALDAQAWGAFFTVFGVFYAIIIGSLITNVLGRFTSLSRTVEEELVALEEVRDLLIYLDENKETKKEIYTALLDYVNSVLGKAWEEMGNINSSFNTDTSNELYKLIKAVHKIKITNESDKFALGALMNKITDITTLRSKRISYAREQLPSRLQTLVTFMSIMLLFGFIFVGVHNIWIHGLMVFSITILIYFAHIILSELNHPFRGVWNINKRPFQEFQRKLKNIVALQ